MLNIFRRKKINIDSIKIPDFGWAKSKSDKSIKEWINPENTIAVSVNFFNLKPDLPTIKDVDYLRDFYRNQISKHNGGLIEVSIKETSGFKYLKTILKFPQDPSGMTYLASLTIPFENYSYVLKIQAAEFGTTGMRDTMISAKMIQSKEITFDENGFIGWFSDPYDPNFNMGTLMNKSEDVKFDEEFPTHPLSQARKLISKIESNIKFDNELRKTSPFIM